MIGALLLVVVFSFLLLTLFAPGRAGELMGRLRVSLPTFGGTAGSFDNPLASGSGGSSVNVAEFSEVRLS